MSRTVTLNGVSYTIPTTGDKGSWSTQMNALLVALVEEIGRAHV